MGNRAGERKTGKIHVKDGRQFCPLFSLVKADQSDLEVGGPLSANELPIGNGQKTESASQSKWERNTCSCVLMK